MASKLDPYRDTIQHLYMVKNKTVESIMEEMSQAPYFLSASKSSYERQFKKWGVFKKIKQADLRYVSLAIRKRKGKESSVYIKGKLIEASEIKRKIARCYFTAQDRFARPLCSPPIDPMEFIVTTPPRCPASPPIHPMEVFVTTPPRFPASPPVVYMGRGNPWHSATPEVLVVPKGISASYMALVKSSDLPITQFTRQVESLGNLQQFIQMPEDMVAMALPFLSLDRWQIVDRSNTMKLVFNKLRALMLVQDDQEIYSSLWQIVGVSCNRSTVEFLKLAVYLISNNLTGDDTTLSQQIFKWFQLRSNSVFLRAILSHKTPTIEAFAESIFTRALEAEDEVLLRIFLESGVSPDLTVSINPHNVRAGFRKFAVYSMRPLGFAAGIGNMELARLFLLQFGADVNGRSPTEVTTPLQLAAQIGHVGLVDLLLENNAIVEMPQDIVLLSALQCAALAGSMQITKRLLDEGAKLEPAHGSVLACAAESGSMSLVKFLLEKGAKVNPAFVRDVNRNFYLRSVPLQAAVGSRSIDMVKILLGYGADVDAAAIGYYGSTALQRAAKLGELEILQCLLQAGADVNAPPAEYGNTALTAAASEGYHDVVKILLKAGADVNDKRGGRTALEGAVERGDLEMVQILVAAGADASCDRSVVLAIQKNHFDILSLLLTAGADIQRNGGELLSFAVKRQDIGFVRLLLKNGVSPNNGILKEDSGRPAAIRVAAGVGNLEMLQILIGAEAEIDVYSHYFSEHCRPYRTVTALQAAAGCSHLDIVRYLLQAGADLNMPAHPDHGRTALQGAVESRSLEMIRFLLDEGADVNAPAAKFMGVTALQAAVRRNDRQMIHLLLDAGAHANDLPSDTYGLSSLQIAAAHGLDDVVEILLNRGADVNGPCARKGGQTALMAAASVGHVGTVRLLLKAKADVNAVVSNSWCSKTALVAAAGGGYLRIAQDLINHGADVNATTKGAYHGTALQEAAMRGRIDMLKLLLNAGAKITGRRGGAQYDWAVRYATRNGHNAAVKFLQYYRISRESEAEESDDGSEYSDDEAEYHDDEYSDSEYSDDE
ncbi:ankyrin repeat protein [Phlyctema vagabunda]|uniref:Ankyrin repeat protein n=1 Tax=Phlyctema vagabunda TaxID=108571 RepID=A0ABR4P9C7_9HELO